MIIDPYSIEREERRDVKDLILPKYTTPEVSEILKYTGTICIIYTNMFNRFLMPHKCKLLNATHNVIILGQGTVCGVNTYAGHLLLITDVASRRGLYSFSFTYDYAKQLTMDNIRIVDLPPEV